MVEKQSNPISEIREADVSEKPISYIHSEIEDNTEEPNISDNKKTDLHKKTSAAKGKIINIIGYSLLTIFLLALFIYITFPYKIVQNNITELIINQAKAQNLALNLNLGDLKLVPFTSIVTKNAKLEITYPESNFTRNWKIHAGLDNKLVIKIDSIKANISLLQLFTGSVVAKVNIKLANNRGSIYFKSKAPIKALMNQSNFQNHDLILNNVLHSLELKIDSLKLGKELTQLWRTIPEPTIKALVPDFEVDFNLNANLQVAGGLKAGKNNYNGKLLLSLDKLTLNFDDTYDYEAFQTFNIDGEFKNNIITLTDKTLISSDNLNIKAAGDIEVLNPTQNSIALNLFVKAPNALISTVSMTGLKCPTEPGPVEGSEQINANLTASYTSRSFSQESCIPNNQ